MTPIEKKDAVFLLRVQPWMMCCSSHNRVGEKHVAPAQLIAFEGSEVGDDAVEQVWEVGCWIRSRRGS